VADARDDAVHDAAVLIEADRVQSVGRYPALRRAYPLAAEHDAAGLVALPGLVDAHSHGRGIPMTEHGIEDAPLEVWLARLTAATALDPHDGALLAGAELVSTGVTGVQVFFHTFAGPDEYLAELGATAEGIGRSGIQFDLVLGITDQHEFLPPLDAETPPNAVARSLASPKRGVDPATYFELFDALSRGRGAGPGAAELERARESLAGTRLVLGPVAPQWASGQVLEGVAARMRSGARGHTHLLEREGQRLPLYGPSPVERLEVSGMLTDGLSVAHGVWLEPEERALLASQGTAVVHCPGSNTRLEAGAAPVRDLLDVGVPVALGLDSNPVCEPPDAFVEMRHALEVAEAAGAPISPREALAMATLGGAEAVGRWGEIGALRPGARADLILLDLRGALAGDDLASNIVSGASRAQVREVWIGGRVVLSDGRSHVRAEVEAARGRLWAALREDLNQRRRRLRELEEIEPWLKGLWERAGAEGVEPLGRRRG
jgi:cytosine/adenosine deaminase-related metal-dependent hydrolase